MIDEILDLLHRTQSLRDCRIWQRDETPSGAFVLKVRCRAVGRFTFQTWIKQGSKGLRYSYQLTSNGTTMRWDNSPHFPGLENFPNHYHDARGRRRSSDLTGDPLRDLPRVLLEVEKFLES